LFSLVLNSFRILFSFPLALLCCFCRCNILSRARKAFFIFQIALSSVSSNCFSGSIFIHFCPFCPFIPNTYPTALPIACTISVIIGIVSAFLRYMSRILLAVFRRVARFWGSFPVVPSKALYNGLGCLIRL